MWRIVATGVDMSEPQMMVDLVYQDVLKRARERASGRSMICVVMRIDPVRRDADVPEPLWVVRHTHRESTRVVIGTAEEPDSSSMEQRGEPIAALCADAAFGLQSGNHSVYAGRMRRVLAWQSASAPRAIPNLKRLWVRAIWGETGCEVVELR